MKAKPDCTGQQFGMLTVLGKGSRAAYKKARGKETYCYLWRLQCECGAQIELRRGDFDRRTRSGQTSCGCARKRGLVDNKRRPIDISGKRFGSLTAIALTGNKDAYSKPTWQMLCDCGSTREISLSDIRRREYKGIRIICGNRSLHPEKWLSYPPTPNPYPAKAGELLVKYLPVTELNYQQIDSEVSDEKRDRLFRAAWIITYRRSQGEHISELHEKRIIYKHLRYCSIDVFWRRKLEANGGFLYNVSGNKKSHVSGGSFPQKAGAELGSKMTNVTSNDYPELQLQETKLLPKKRLKFKRH